MGANRTDKIARLVQKELGVYFQRNSQSMFEGKMITVTAVRVTADLALAKVYLSLFPVEDKEQFLALINDQNSTIRYDLGKKIGKQVRIIPELRFYLDDSLDYIENIDNLLKDK